MDELHLSLEDEERIQQAADGLGINPDLLRYYIQFGPDAPRPPARLPRWKIRFLFPFLDAWWPEVVDVWRLAPRFFARVLGVQSQDPRASVSILGGGCVRCLLLDLGDELDRPGTQFHPTPPKPSCSPVVLLNHGG